MMRIDNVEYLNTGRTKNVQDLRSNHALPFQLSLINLLQTLSVSCFVGKFTPFCILGDSKNERTY